MHGWVWAQALKLLRGATDEVRRLKECGVPTIVGQQELLGAVVGTMLQGQAEARRRHAAAMEEVITMVTAAILMEEIGRRCCCIHYDYRTHCSCSTYCHYGGDRETLLLHSL